MSNNKEIDREKILETIDEIEKELENQEEDRELTEEEKRELYIKQLKESHIRFHPITHDGKYTYNKYGVEYRKKRKIKNRLTKKSRKANRKK